MECWQQQAVLCIWYGTIPLRRIPFNKLIFVLLLSISFYPPLNLERHKVIANIYIPDESVICVPHRTLLKLKTASKSLKLSVFCTVSRSKRLSWLRFLVISFAMFLALTEWSNSICNGWQCNCLHFWKKSLKPFSFYLNRNQFTFSHTDFFRFNREFH